MKENAILVETFVMTAAPHRDPTPLDDAATISWHTNDWQASHEQDISNTAMFSTDPRINYWQAKARQCCDATVEKQTFQFCRSAPNFQIVSHLARHTRNGLVKEIGIRALCEFDKIDIEFRG